MFQIYLFKIANQWTIFLGLKKIKQNILFISQNFNTFEGRF